jgi:hypothetical protein
MFTKHKITPKIDSSEFTLADSYSISGEESVFIRARKGSIIEVFFQDAIDDWVSIQTIDASEEAKGVHLELYPAADYINFVDHTALLKKVVVFPLSHGLSTDSAAGPVFSGEDVHTSERVALETRIANIEGLEFVTRPKHALAPYAYIPSNTFLDLGTDYAGIKNNAHILWLDGRAIPSSDYSVHPLDDGRLSFFFDIDVPEEGGVISCSVWQEVI